jgi:hypothetical protein
VGQWQALCGAVNDPKGCSSPEGNRAAAFALISLAVDQSRSMRRGCPQAVGIHSGDGSRTNAVIR